MSPFITRCETVSRGLCQVLRLHVLLKTGPGEVNTASVDGDVASAAVEMKQFNLEMATDELRMETVGYRTKPITGDGELARKL